MLGSVQIAGEEVGGIETKDICDSLQRNTIKLLSLRACSIDDSLYRKMTECLMVNESLVHLNLNMGIVSTQDRVKWLAEGLNRNVGLTSIFLHGTQLGDEGMAVLTPALETHPRLQVLDLGDCHLGDESVANICSVLKPKPGRAGVLELTLTGNKDVSQSGWSQLAMCLAHGCQLQKLFLDYNNIGDFGAGLFGVALASTLHLVTLDLEDCGITDGGADLLCDSLEQWNSTLTELNLASNKISPEILEAVTELLQENANG